MKFDKFIDRFVAWVLVSSADPKKASLTIKGFLVICVGYFAQTTSLLCGLGVVCLVTDSSALDSIVEGLSNIVFWGLSIAGAAVSIWGGIRKIWLSASGQNEVLK